ncbi:TetR/AcrR family transcriptional regulator [Pusillimonas caeni]|uniref:TetR/AcrR family transcriptional regulator n=1 Tax=Pusillimonas caeni TaxID=1348472 RepID=UPI00143098C7|nr:TetR/AcrR family transcriptional regulator [Pusillimonas caeni]
MSSAFRLFSESGYNETSIPAIARAAGMSTANVYIYFKSKLDILFTLYEPWLVNFLDRLDRSLQRIEAEPKKIERLLKGLWLELPRESNGFANNIMQALSTSRSDQYDPRLRLLLEQRVSGWITDCLDVTPSTASAIAEVVLVAFDGYAMTYHLEQGVTCNMKTVRLFAQYLQDN